VYGLYCRLQQQVSNVAELSSSRCRVKRVAKRLSRWFRRCAVPMKQGNNKIYGAQECMTSALLIFPIISSYFSS
jgi:hypothetical protein